MKKYEFYLDNSKWEQGLQLGVFESWLKSIGIDTQFNPNTSHVSERLDIRVKIPSGNAFRDNTSVRIHRKGGRYWITLKLRSMDPLVLAHVNLNTNKKHTVRYCQLFRDKNTLYEKSYRIDIKPNKVFKTWKDIYNLFPGLAKCIGIHRDEPILYRPTKYIWGLKNSAKLYGRKTHYKISIYHGSADDARMRHSGYCCRFEITVKEPKIKDDTWVEHLKNLYHLFYYKIIASEWNCSGPIRKTPLFRPSKNAEPRPTREYQIYFSPSKWQERDQTVEHFNNFLKSLVSKSGLNSVNLTNTDTRLLEHFGLDTPDLLLKSRVMDEVVVKLERNVDTGISQLTCKYKGFDVTIVQSFPVRVKYGYLATSKIEQDYHPGFARMAISLVANIPPQNILETWKDLDDIFPGLCKFCDIEPSTPIYIRLYKVKWEQTKQELVINNYKAIGKISLEYPTIEEARDGRNLFHGQWSFRIKLPRTNTGKVWTNILWSSYNLYYDYLVPSEWNYEGTHCKPDRKITKVPPLIQV